MKTEMTTTTNFTPISCALQSPTIKECSIISRGYYHYSYFIKDHLGSTRMVLAQDGEVKKALVYQPYGTVSDVQAISASRADPLRQKFTTKEFDEEGVLSDDAKIEWKIIIEVPSDKFTGNFEYKTIDNFPIGYNLSNSRDVNGVYHLTSPTISNSGSSEFYEYMEIQIANTETSETWNYNLYDLNWTYDAGYLKFYKT